MKVKDRLKKELDLLNVFCIASGAMISSGLFILPGIAYAKTGPSVFLAYIVAGIFVLPALLSKAELTTAMPRAGGTYFFIDRSFGPAIGVMGGFADWISVSFKSAFALVGMGAFAKLIYSDLTFGQIKSVAILFCVLFMLINLIGVKYAGKFQVTMVVLLIAILFLFIYRGIPHVKVERLAPFAPYGIGSLFATAGMVFISYGGLTKVAAISEEVKDPGRNIPLGMLLSLAVVTLFYFLAIFVTVGTMHPAELRNSLTPLSDSAGIFMGTFGVVLLAVAALAAFITTANAGIMSASRGPMAMSRDSLLPDFFRRVNNRFKTPHVSIIFTTCFMIVLILFLDLELFIKAASQLIITLFILVNLAVIVMRESKIQSYRPKFKSPLYPWVQILGIFGYGFLIFEMSSKDIRPLIGNSLFFACAFIWYLTYGRTKVKRASALIRVVERVTEKDTKLTSETLGEELKDILKERDNIVEDRFDGLIKRCEVLDLAGQMRLEDFLGMVSGKLSGKLRIDKRALLKMFVDREKESTTALRPGLAIPHIVIDGKNIFEIMLVRCKKGISFSSNTPPVHAVFLLVGSEDERNFHLRVLMSIAQITEEAGFDKKWLEARDAEELRDIVLLAKRRRH